MEMPLLGRHLPDPTSNAMLKANLLLMVIITITTESIYHITDILEVKRKHLNPHPKMQETAIQYVH